MALHQFKQYRLLVGKIRIERALGKSRSFRDIANRGESKTLLDDLVARSLDQEIPGTSLTFLAIQPRHRTKPPDLR
jgi:hypothetical protein